MSALHTLNGKPLAGNWKRSTGCVVIDWKHYYEVAAVRKNALETALREALAIIDEDRSGAKSGWSHEDSAKLERLRALVKV